MVLILSHRVLQLFPPTNTSVHHISLGKRRMLSRDVLTVSCISDPSTAFFPHHYKVQWDRQNSPGRSPGQQVYTRLILKSENSQNIPLNCRGEVAKGWGLQRPGSVTSTRKPGNLFPWLFPCYLQKGHHQPGSSRDSFSLYRQSSTQSYYSGETLLVSLFPVCKRGGKRWLSPKTMQLAHFPCCQSNGGIWL